MFGETAIFGNSLQIGVFFGLTALVGLRTWWKVRQAARGKSEQDVYLA